MSKERDYRLALDPHKVDVTVNLEWLNKEVYYSAWSSSPTCPGPSFVGELSSKELAEITTHREALIAVARKLQPEGLFCLSMDDESFASLLLEGELPAEDEQATCPGCNGKGKYIGAWKVEDPCERCNGSGLV